ncbi:hypothetical protein NSPZN2_11002 [Nitrospira defluvii]|uniref:Uncharacterized protein n=1 Tax=Nitrospira defluvii TaxID=330214 RepID=A0ABM8QN99_9BACT|nr:hypothetical protein NSPZN2_11002 [Nitrospira defluvii]
MLGRMLGIFALGLSPLPVLMPMMRRFSIGQAILPQTCRVLHWGVSKYLFMES